MRTRPLAIALGLALAATTLPATANDGRSQILADVSRELHFYVNDVEPESLTTHQLASIRAILHGNYSSSDKRARIRSVIGGQYSLRGLLFN